VEPLHKLSFSFGQATSGDEFVHGGSTARQPDGDLVPLLTGRCVWRAVLRLFEPLSQLHQVLIG